MVRAAEEMKRRLGIKVFPVVDDYFAAVQAVRQGESPVAAVVLNSQDGLEDSYQVPEYARRVRRYDGAMAASKRRKEIRTIPSKRDTIRGRDIVEMKPNVIYDRNAARRHTRVRQGIASTEFPYANVASLPQSLRDKVLFEYRADHAEFILEVLKRHRGMDIGRMMDAGAFVPDIENQIVYFIDANVESMLADKGLKPNDFHKYERLGVLSYIATGMGLVQVKAGEERLPKRQLDAKDVYSEVKTPRGMKSIVAREPILVHLKADVASNLFRGRYRDTPPKPNPIEHAPLHYE